ncbi:putative uncharacterized protein DDB_G0282133 [Condylostylus longicornis]|uniref:putative uncharacterized protein DDB_G0282133 n=1 Tax=Condylostylus longicornis TaxID=2530218 RepID=UPI00244E1387|nr:putative uncharacterized protein DDB_G0282133 [Condylostylus longicornis]
MGSIVLVIFKIFLINSLIFIRIINSDELNLLNTPSDRIFKNDIKNPNYTTYKLQVPGSNSITIVEAIKKENKPNMAIQKKDLNKWNYSNQENINATPSLLEKFLSEYNFKINPSAPSKEFLQNISNIKLSHRDNRYNEHYFDQSETENSEDYFNNKYDNQQFYQQDLINQQNSHTNIPKNYYNLLNTHENSEIISSTESDRYSDTKADNKKWTSLQPVHWSKSQVLKWKPKNKVLQTYSTSNRYSYMNREPDDTRIPSLRRKWTNSYHDFPETYQNRDKDYLNFNGNIMEAYNKYPNLGNENLNDFDQNSQKLHSNSKPTRNPHNGNNYYERPEIEVSSSYDRYYDYGHRPDFESDYNHENHKNNYNMKNPFSTTPYNNNYDDFDTAASSQHATFITPYNIKRVKPHYYYGHHHDNTQTRNFLKDRIPNPNLSDSNGEWILVTSNKGYEKPLKSSRPTRYTHNTSKNSSLITTSSQPILSILDSKPPITNFRTHKSVKLYVLPSNSNETINLSHNGLLEVDKSSETVESSVAETDKKKGTKRKVKQMKLISVPVSNVHTDHSAVLAAVGAGMVPATMAMLMPMVLGRRKRSIIASNQRNES